VTNIKSRCAVCGAVSVMFRAVNPRPTSQKIWGGFFVRSVQAMGYGFVSSYAHVIGLYIKLIFNVIGIDLG